MFAVYEHCDAWRSLRGNFFSFVDACDYVRSLSPVDFEIDTDHPGCADAILRSGIILAIEGKL